MKRIITLSILCMVCLFSRAQFYIKIDVNAGELETSLTEEQMENVEQITVTGSLNAADLSVINERMPKLSWLDLENVSLDSIPAKAFYGNKSLRDIYSPLQIEYVGDRAFEGTQLCLTITGRFPRMGEWVFGEKEFNIDVLHRNEYCEVLYPYVFSKDIKILYYIMHGSVRFDESIPEPTEIIAGWALAYARIIHVEFPSTLKKIEKHAFAKTTISPRPISYYPYEPTRLDFYSPVPPVLEEGVFTENEIFREYYIRVPAGCREVYKAADPQWSVFYTILEEGEADPEYIPSNTSPALLITKDTNGWILSNERGISHVEMYNSLGVLTYSHAFDDTSAYVPYGHESYGIRYVKVIYSDNTFETIKLTD